VTLAFAVSGTTEDQKEPFARVQREQPWLILMFVKLMIFAKIQQHAAKVVPQKIPPILAHVMKAIINCNQTKSVAKSRVNSIMLA